MRPTCSAANALAAVEQMWSPADRVRRVLSHALREGETTLATVAEKLHMSERSLQRRLADDAVTFDALLDELRRAACRSGR